MSEIARMRFLRAPQRRCVPEGEQIPLYPGGRLSDLALSVLSPDALHGDQIAAGALQRSGITETATAG
jgi:hypothetical protein